MEYRYKISVVMAVYNVEPWIREAIDSIIGQDIGFKNIQLILVDDGSHDNSGAICDEYATLYPSNIVVVHKENGGQSSARNAGIKISSGKYLSFLDPDDILQKNAFSSVFQFFEEHHDETDVVAVPIFMFGFQHGPHSLNDKFRSGSRIIDLENEWQTTQLSLAASFVKTDIAKAYAFEENLEMPAAEDARELIKLLTQKNTLGVVHNTKYMYRKRENSSLHNITQKKEYYTDYIPKFPVWAFDYCKKVLGYIPRFVMHTIMYDLQWHLRLNDIPEGVLTEQEKQEYYIALEKLFQDIDDAVIMAQKSIYTEQKSYILAKKYGCSPQKITYGSDILFGYNNKVFFGLSNTAFHLCTFEVALETAYISVWTPAFIHYDDEALEVFAKVNEKIVPAKVVNAGPARYCMGTPIYEKRFLYFEVPLPKSGSVTISFFRNYNSVEIPYKNVVADKYFPVGKEYGNAYYYDKHYVMQMRGNNLIVRRKEKLHPVYEKNFRKELWRKNRLGGRKAAIIRPIIMFLRKFIKKPIWLFADKSDRADDNAEALFEYCCREQAGKYRYIFLLSKDSPDYERIKKIGPVIPYMSKWHRLVYLLADNIISAYSHDELNNPFLGHEAHYRDLLQKCNYVFLQHGIIKDDLSAGLNKMHKNIKAFVCSTTRERNSILETPAYGYVDNEVVLTGLPRYDRLYNATKNEIVIMPTWRRNLMGSYHKEDSRWDLLPGFEQSDYCQFYNDLMASEKLYQAMQKYGFRLNFMPHPVMFPYADCFEIPSHVKLLTYDASYREVFATNRLLLTDYSSVAFDFAYLRKPVIYTHFDNNHYEEGYFNYERDGFGEVEYTLDGTIDRMIEYMKNDCILKEIYRERIDDFFAFNDKNNCQRVFHVIKGLEISV